MQLRRFFLWLPIIFSLLSERKNGCVFVLYRPCVDLIPMLDTVHEGRTVRVLVECYGFHVQVYRYWFKVLIISVEFSTALVYFAASPGRSLRV